MRPHRRQPTGLPRPWDSPGKNTGVGCHFPLQCVKVKSESEVTQLCLTLSDPMDCSLPGSSVHGIFQARVLEWGAIALVAQMVKNPPRVQETQFQSLGWEDPPEKQMATHGVILACRIPWTEKPGGLRLWGHKESDMTNTFTSLLIRTQVLLKDINEEEVI